MALVNAIADLGGISIRTIGITGKKMDGASAAGYAAWVESITGSYPKIVDNGDRTATVVHTREQVKKMRSWLDEMAYSAIRPDREKPSLSVDFGPIIKPTALKYAVTFAAAAFLAGWLSRGFLK